MPWFKIDDTFAMHEKVMAAGNPAIGLWARAGAWSMQQLTDGFVPDHVLRALGTPKERRTLVQVSLWEEAEGGITFRNWAERQPTKEQVETARQAAAERQRHARERAKSQRESRRDKGVSHGPPDPTRPDPTPKDKEGSAVAEEFDDFWTIYPRKEGKGAARKAWAKAVKILPASELLPIVRSYSVRVHGTEQRFIPFPATWLNQERWADEVNDQQAEANGDDGWFQPFTMPPAPPEVEGDPEAYEAWAEGRRAAWRAGERW